MKKARDTDYSVVSWRAWFTDCREYDSRTTRWEDLPADGALVFVLYKANGHRRIMQGVSLYWKEDTPKGTIYACDNVSDAILPEGQDPTLLKRGKWTTDEEYESVRIVAANSFPPE